MTLQQQRFCPLCDRSFVEGEAVLRCDGCGVMHHPGCWVTNAGCATQSPHKSVPVALAYSTQRSLGTEAPHPGEGIRVAASVREAPLRPPAPIPAFGPPAEEGAPEPVIGGEEWPVIGATPPRTVHRTIPMGPTAPPVPPRRYVPPGADGQSYRRPMPKIYGGNPLLRYWYVPVAAGLAVLVALIVIWFAGLFGGDSNTATTTPTTAPGAATTPSVQASVAGATTPNSSVTPGANSSDKFAIGGVAVVTGAGDCLNVRTAPGTANDAIVCLKDAEEVTVTGGPEPAGGLIWWKVKTKLGEGWAAQDYLERK